MENDKSYVIAERELKLAPENIVCKMSIYSPIRDKSDYSCRFEIVGLSTIVSGKAFGIDSLQALSHAMNDVGAALYFSDEYKDGNLSWSGSRNLNLPVSSAIAHLVPSVE